MPEKPWEYTLHIPNDPRAVPICRRTLRLVLAAHALPHLSHDAELLGTELVTNAVTHTKGPVALRVRWTGAALRVGAWDAEPTPPMPGPFGVRATGDGAEAGRGLALVRACADDWGWHRLTYAGKYVWCELAGVAPRTGASANRTGPRA
ncbi:ATP-binding protein [Streptomyces iconiensis]|uniref:ATP-binding protein n=1 Tax=Streptomyces iconiensis TaxID=1384038 RepID=A0ABT7A3Z9_9ACTN|nr:ATP-binding protein [Streptomyces iconiensis]MDJ1136073.1 ATP-binding protein [Streptomyces iconiensis]